jgi:hypothetical protein
MSIKEKANELVNKYLQIYDGKVIEAKKCAIVAVNEVLNALAFDFENPSENTIYWLKVKQEIQKL